MEARSRIDRARFWIDLRDPVILFMPMEKPRDRLACSMPARRGSRALFHPRGGCSGIREYEVRYTVPTGGISAPNVPRSFHHIDLNY